MHFSSALIWCFIALNVAVNNCVCEKSYWEILRDNYFEVFYDLFNFTFNLLSRKLVKNPSISSSTESPSPCTLEAAVFDEYFNYIKHVCFVAKKVTYAAATTDCESKSMKLFSISTVDELNALLVYAEERFPAPGKFYWTKGQLISGSWFLNTDELLIDNAIPIDPSSAGNCLSIANLNGVFITRGSQCDSMSDGFFCDFIKEL